MIVPFFILKIRGVTINSVMSTSEKRFRYTFEKKERIQKNKGEYGNV